MKKIVLLGLGLLLSQGIFAKNVHKCVVNGSVTYQSRPCAGTVERNPQQQMQQKLVQRTATQNAKMRELEKLNQAQTAPEPVHQYSQSQHLQRRSDNGTSNQIPDTVEGKKRSLAIAQDAYQKTKKQ